MTPWTLLALAGVFGALVGSFLNVAVDRSIAGRSLAYPPSACDSCGRRLRPWELIPVLSWLALRGRCAGCGVRLSVQYPLVELGGAGLAALSVFLLGPSLLAAAVFAGLAALFAAALVDSKTKELPDGMVLGAAGLATLLAVAVVSVTSGAPSAAAALLYGGVAAGALGLLDALFTWLLRGGRARRFASAADYPFAAVPLTLGALLAPWVAGEASWLLAAFAVTVVYGVVVFRTPLHDRAARMLSALEVPLLVVTLVTLVARAVTAGGVDTLLTALAWFGVSLMGLAAVWAPALLDGPRRARLAALEASEAGDPVAVGFGDIKYAFMLGALLTVALGTSGVAAAALWLVPTSAVLAVTLSALKVKVLPFGPLIFVAGVLALLFPAWPLAVLGF